MKSRIDRWTTRNLTYLHRRFYLDHRRHRPLELVWEQSAAESASFISANLEYAVLFDSREDLWRHALRSMPSDGLIMECGVFQGQSINMIADWLSARRDQRLAHGFDSFEGLEEDWFGENLPAGFFDLKGRLPSVRANVQLHKGWVQDTVAPFLAEHPDQPIALVHIDTDTYTPARYILETVKPRLKSGSLVVFDELVGYPNWQRHEYKALCETMDAASYDFIGFTSRQAILRVK